jgi:hypothetical protein
MEGDLQWKQVQSRESISCPPLLYVHTAQDDEVAEKLGVDADRDIH